MNKTLLSIALVGALGFTSVTQAVIIDDFTVNQGAQDSTNGSPVSGTPGDVDPGGPFTSRALSAERNDGTAFAGFVRVISNSPFGSLSVGSTSSVTGDLSLTWRTPSPGPLDLTAGGDDAFELVYDTSGSQQALIEIVLTDFTNGNSSAWQGSGLANATAGAVLRIPYADFAGFGGPAADLSEISEILVVFRVPTDSFLELQSIQTGLAPAAAPIPSSLALLGLGLIGMRRFRRRA